MILSLSISVFAQDDDTIQYIQGLPESGNDESEQIPPADPQFNKMSRVSPERVPAPLQKAFNENPKFSNWRDGDVYYDKNTRLYRLVFNREEALITYSFDSEGNLVSLNEKDNQ